MSGSIQGSCKAFVLLFELFTDSNQGRQHFYLKETHTEQHSPEAHLSVLHTHYKKMLYDKTKYHSEMLIDRGTQEVCGTIIPSNCLLCFPLHPQYQFSCFCSSEILATQPKGFVSDPLTVINQCVLQKPCSIFAICTC